MLKALQSASVDGPVNNDKGKTRVQNGNPIWDQNEQNQYLNYDQNG